MESAICSQAWMNFASRLSPASTSASSCQSTCKEEGWWPEEQEHMRTERVGSLLTQLLRHFQIDLSTATCVERIEYIDTPYLIHCDILRDDETYFLCCKDRLPLFCKLSQPFITQLGDIEHMRFLPAPDYLCSDPIASSSRTRPRWSTLQASQPHLEDDDMPDFAETPLSGRAPLSSEFQLLPISDDADNA